MPDAKEQGHLDSPALACRNVRLRAGIRYQSPTHIDAETDRTLRKADEEVEVRHVNDLPAPAPGMRIGSPQCRVYREEVCQSLNMQLNSMKHQLRDYYEEKRQQVEKLRKEMLSATRCRSVARTPHNSRVM